MKNQKGFTLIEIAIVLVIMGLLLGLGIPMMRTLIQSNKLTEDRLAVKEAKDALIGYAMARGHFPVPIVTSASNYYLPYKLLGVRSKDGHGERLIYDVRSDLTIAKAKAKANISVFCTQVRKDILSSFLTRPMIDGHSIAFVVISKGANYKLDASNNTSAGTYENQSHPYNKDTSDDIVRQEGLGDLHRICVNLDYQ